VWEYYSGGKKVVQAEARGKCSRPSLAAFFAEDGQSIVRTEEDTNCNGTPDQRTEIAPDGQATLQCTVYTKVTFVGGAPQVEIEDSNKDGFGDRRQIYEAGVLVQVDADTNADRKPDVWLTYTDGNPSLQYEDTNFDGTADQLFDLASEKPLPMNAAAASRLSREGFEKIGCSGTFSEYWKTWKK